MENRGFFEEEYFRKFYKNYEYQNPPAKMEFYRSLVLAAVKGKANPRLLEAGCAFGRFLSSLGPSWQRYGFDISEFAVASAFKAVPEARLAVSALPEIPFEGPFDVIVSFDVLEHVPDVEEAILAVRSKLAPGGHFIFVVPVYDGLTGPVIRALDKDTSHLHKESRSFWLNLAGRHFKVESWWGIYRFLFPGGYYFHRPTQLLRGLTPAIAVVARRTN
ncbi:MAG: methyltransferase domain-containing protein [Thermodesulfobacteriota bacterium]